MEGDAAGGLERRLASGLESWPGRVGLEDLKINPLLLSSTLSCADPIDVGSSTQ